MQSLKLLKEHMNRCTIFLYIEYKLTARVIILHVSTESSHPQTEHLSQRNYIDGGTSHQYTAPLMLIYTISD